MKIIIAGSRHYDDLEIVEECMRRSGLKAAEVVSGGAKGIDGLAISWALRHSLPYILFKADWNKYGKQAGFIRNQQMLNYADALVVIWDGYSSGTKDILKKAKRMNFKTILLKQN